MTYKLGLLGVLPGNCILQCAQVLGKVLFEDGDKFPQQVSVVAHAHEEFGEIYAMSLGSGFVLFHCCCPFLGGFGTASS
jgi:hypothetical protein